MIVVATLSGFGIIDRSTNASREHSEAAVLAAESQEALRTDPASTFVKLSQAPVEYTKTVSGITYTVKQSANFIGAEKSSGTCSATETSRKSTNAVRIASTVSWTETNTKATPVTESGIITPPTGSALEVDVANGAPGTIGTPEATAIITYTPAETSTPASIQGATGSAGCIVFGGIPATSASVEIPEHSGYVMPNGDLKVTTKEVEIAPNLTTHYLVAFAGGGNIEARFTYEKQTSYLGQPVEGDTFVVANKLMNELPDFEVGSHGFKYEAGGEEVATALTGEYSSENVIGPTGAKYSSGNLFPFPESEWEVYAGDCEENNPAILTKGTVENGHGDVTSGNRTPINIPLSLLALNVYEGASPKSPKSLASTHYPVTITNVKCAGATPNNETTVNYKHVQQTSASGHLEHFFQPFGKEFELCLANEKQNRVYKVKYGILTANSTAPSIYLGQPSEAQRTESREAAEKEEAAARTKRIAEENPAWEKLKTEETTLSTQKSKEETKWTTRESEETNLKNAQTAEENTKKTDEATEAANRTTWANEEKTQEKKGKHRKPTAKEEEAAQTVTRKARETTEEKNRATRKSEETTLHARKTTEEGTKATRVKEEATVASTRASLTTARTKAEGTEETAKSARIAKEATEKSEASSEVLVTSGKSC